ncbi:hypothetical protein EW146_g7094 [Bondarzewia mesenterica]|uniref:Mak10-domain-containing protein n=1 Tax=Bondarzewia mesenterica TaxID=1095465 RepID=A0A4S4LNK5_9AGAM|nr:hypothetical protein EW146_g7094 [Bondarzewia mesenterica]
MDSYPAQNISGGDDFHDVTDLFREAADNMEPGTVLLTDGFTLMDSMSAIEIGEPRLDTGMELDEERRPPFNPLTPLLPEELCYIMDRTFSCEMEWHAGNTLTQTVYTLLYVHHFDELDPENTPLIPWDSARPPELITIVLRAFVAGLLKCCDRAWRELTKGRVFDTEDWQSEKSGISLLEMMPVQTVSSYLDNACAWLLTHSQDSLPWRDSLLDRLMFRRTILELFSLDLSTERERFQSLLSSARNYLHAIRFRPAPPTPLAESPALLSFDLYISRRLNTFVPLQILHLPPQERVWDALENLIDGWVEVCQLSAVSILTTWKIAGTLQALSTPSDANLPYIRSLTQSVFFNGYRVLGSRPLPWTLEQFFVETLGVPWTRIREIIQQHSVADNSPRSLRDFEQRLIMVVINNIKSSWFNPPRRRRQLSNSLLDWHASYDMFMEMTSALHVEDESELALMHAASKTILIWRLRTIFDVIFAGFQLDLYVADEKPFAYWYASHIIGTYLSMVDNIAPIVPKDSATYSELEFEYGFFTAMQDICTGMFILTLPSLDYSGDRLVQNIIKRYKWAFRSEYQTISRAPVAPPDLPLFLSTCSEILQNEDFPIASSFSRAQQSLNQLDRSQVGWAGPWKTERMKFVHSISRFAGTMSQAAPKTLRELHRFDASVLDWSSTKYNYFPNVRES